MSGAYYSEFDPFAAAWLRELIKTGLIAGGEVDERDLWDVTPSELRGFTQVHLCAGIGVWSYALRRAGWPDDRPVWTGSFPCQPFSAAGADGSLRNQIEDRSHLGRWPANIIQDGSGEVLAAFPDAKGQLADESRSAPSAKTSTVYGAMKRQGEPSQNSANEGAVGFKMRPGARRLDSGSAARFFYCAKASKADRQDGVPLKPDGKPGNGHPTVKPTELMRYLCRLVTPPGGTVLDPFMGSGSTGRGAVLEGFDFIGVEMDVAYLKIARARIAAAQREGGQALGGRPIRRLTLEDMLE